MSFKALHRKIRARWRVLTGPHYVEQIQVLKAEHPIALPAVKPLKGRIVGEPQAHHLIPFGRHL